MKQRLLIIIFFAIAVGEVSAQLPLPLPMLMAPGGGGRKKKGMPFNNFDSPKVLIDVNTRTGRKDTISTGSLVKLWIKSEELRNIRQPLLKSDFNKKTYYLEGQLVSISDSNVVFMKNQAPSPLPPPLSLIPALVKKKVEFRPMLDTISIKDITKFRKSDMVVEGTLKGLTMMPAMTLLPEDFTTWPGMLFMMPGTMIASNLFGSAIFSTHKVNATGGNHLLTVGNNTPKKLLFPTKEKITYETEWGYEKFDQWNRVKDKIYDQLLVKAMNEYRGNKIMSISLGYMIFPEYVIGPDDRKTKVSIPEKKFVFGFTMEDFLSQKIRVGMEMQTHKLAPSMGNPASGSISGGMGFIFSNYTFIKIALGNGLYSEKYKERLKIQIDELGKGAIDIDNNLKAQVNLLRTKLLADPKPYFMFGAGAINTTLMKISGSSSGNMSVKDYTQKKFSLTAGVGVFTRLGMRLTYDLSCRYVYSPDYSPTIGGLYNYSGFKLQLNIGYMTGQSFSNMKRIYKEASKEYLGHNKVNNKDF